MIEGAGDIASITALIQPLAQQYGVNGKIRQVMVAGHGNSDNIQLAGEASDNIVGGPGDQSLDENNTQSLQTNDESSRRLMEAITQNMENSPEARIVLNACLTASEYVPNDLDSDPVIARQQINDTIQQNPSLRQQFQEQANAINPNVRVAGANGSFGQVSLIDPQTGRLDILPIGSPDPALTSEPIEYVRSGIEPTGVMRATVRCWADANITQDQFRTAVDEHYNNAPGNYEGRLIHAYFGIILNNINDGQLMNRLSHSSDFLSEFINPDEYNEVNQLISIRSWIGNHLDTIYSDIITAAGISGSNEKTNNPP